MGQIHDDNTLGDKSTRKQIFQEETTLFEEVVADFLLNGIYSATLAELCQKLCDLVNLGQRQKN
jgi:hypothetical protein